MKNCAVGSRKQNTYMKNAEKSGTQHFLPDVVIVLSAGVVLSWPGWIHFTKREFTLRLIAFASRQTGRKHSRSSQQAKKEPASLRRDTNNNPGGEKEWNAYLCEGTEWVLIGQFVREVLGAHIDYWERIGIFIITSFQCFWYIQLTFWIMCVSIDTFMSCLWFVRVFGCLTKSSERVRKVLEQSKLNYVLLPVISLKFKSDLYFYSATLRLTNIQKYNIVFFKKMIILVNILQPSFLFYFYN